MISLDWEYENAFRRSVQEMLERNLRLTLWLLWMMPLLDVKEMAAIIGFSENYCYELLSVLRDRKLVVRTTMGRAKGQRYRHWLTREGVLKVADETGEPIPWHLSETGIKWLVRRLPLVEAFYGLVSRLWSMEGVRVDRPVRLLDGRGTIAFDPHLRMFKFSWVREGGIHAVVQYENTAWIALVWVGNMITEHNLKEKGQLAVQQLDERYTPSAWVIVGYDRLAAQQAAEFWPGANVLAVSADGRLERKMEPGPFSEPLWERAQPANLGRPQRVAAWLDRNQAMLALNEPTAYAIFRFIAEWHGPTPSQLKWRFGESYRAALRKLRKAGLVVTLDGAYYLTRPGMRAVANMDRVSAQDVFNRSEVYLKEDGAYRRQQEYHNQALISVAFHLWNHHYDTFAGFRGRRNIEGVTQVAPDAIVCMDQEFDITCRVYLELENTAEYDAGLWDKSNTYRLLEAYMDDWVPLLFIVSSDAAEQRLQAGAADLRLMLTTTYDRFFEGPLVGDDSVWRREGEVENIWYPAMLLDRDPDVLAFFGEL